MKLYKYTYQEIWENVNFKFSPILKSFEVIKETSCGYWIKLNPKKNKFVLKKGTNIYARTSKEEAFEDFIIRKKKQIEILERNVEHLKKMLKKIKDGK